MNELAGYAAAGTALLVAELLSRKDAPKEFSPGEHLLDASGTPLAWRPLADFEYNPCAGPSGPPAGLPAGLFFRGKPAGYDAAWLIQKAQLELQFESVAARYCNTSACITIPVKTQPRVPPICAVAVAGQWLDIVRRAAALQVVGAFSSLGFKDCLTLSERLDDATTRLSNAALRASGGVGGVFEQVASTVRGGIGGLAGGAETEVAEVFSTIRQLATRLDAAANLTGNAITEGALQFGRDLVDPENYLNAVTAALGFAGKAAGAGIANALGSLLMSDVAALAVVGVAGYFVLRRMV